MLGSPRLHLREASSTSDRARELAEAGAPHGALVTAARQIAARGRQGRRWSSPPGALSMSLVLHDTTPLLPLAAAVAVAETCGERAQIKWPNDIWLPGDRKVAGILAEGRPQQGWAVLGIGVNVAVDLDALPADVRERAGTLERPAGDVEPFLDTVLAALTRALALDAETLLSAWRARDALDGREVRWDAGHGAAAGIDAQGRLRVTLPGGGETSLDAGEVHLLRDER